MHVLEPQPNQTILISRLEHDSAKAGMHRTRIEDVQENSILVAAPIQKGVPVPIRPGERLELFYHTATPGEAGRYSARARVFRRVKTNVGQLWLEILSEWRREQQREFVRVEVLIEAFFASASEEKPDDLIPALVRDISGGGLLLVAEEGLTEGEEIRIQLPLGSEQVEVAGEVVRRLDYNQQQAYGIRFINLDEATRRTIIQFVFRRQLELRRKGVGQG